MKILRDYIVPFIAHLFKCTWLFFPGIFFVCLTAACFWLIDQGKDLVIAFAENKQAKAYIFIAISFWVYVSWYSARIIAYLKEEQDKKKIKAIRGNDAVRSADPSFFEIPPSFLQDFPRLIGFAAFLVIELAVLQSSLLRHPLSSGTALFLLFGALALFMFLNKLVGRIRIRNSKLFHRLFILILFIFILLVILVAQKQSFSSHIIGLFWLTLYLHICFLFFINLRRDLVNNENIAMAHRSRIQNPVQKIVTPLLLRLQIPVGEWGYFAVYNLLCVAGLIIYVYCVVNLRLALVIGPLPTVILAFAILLGSSNLITALSVKTKLNFHFFVLLLVLLIQHKESHYLRSFPRVESQRSAYAKRQNIYQYFSDWIRQRPEIDSVGAGKYYPVYFVLSNGGASRSAYWTSSVLGRLEDSTLSDRSRFSKHLFCLSGTSGGGVGVASFFSLLKNARRLPVTEPAFEVSSKNFLQQDFLTFSLARMLGPDFFRYLFFPASSMDRAGALEYSFDHATDTSYYSMHFGVPFDSCVTQQHQSYDLPVLCINTTRMQDGNPGIVSNITITDSNSLKVTDKIFDNRIDVLSLLPDSLNIRLSTCAILGARFPYISPAGRIDEGIPKRNSLPTAKDSIRPSYFVDGGYFDNSGAGVVQEMIRAILSYLDMSKDSVLVSRARKLQIFVVHITNSPVGDPLIRKSTDLQNDLASPILTILGAYNTQTTVNDSRLENFVRDINNDPCQPIHAASYYPINLYKGAGDTSERYTMNWFISKSVIRKMDQRLDSHTELKQLIKIMKSNSY